MNVYYNREKDLFGEMQETLPLECISGYATPLSVHHEEIFGTESSNNDREECNDNTKAIIDQKVHNEENYYLPNANTFDLNKSVLPHNSASVGQNSENYEESTCETPTGTRLREAKKPKQLLQELHKSISTNIIPYKAQSINLPCNKLLKRARTKITFPSNSYSQKPLQRSNPCTGLVSLLSCLFTNEFDLIDINVNLDEIDQLIFSLILQKKYGQDFASHSPLDSQLVERLRLLVSEPSRKRQEEKYKLCFKRALKKELNAFKQNNIVSSKGKYSRENEFIHEYFPKGYNSDQSIFNPKTVNLKYVAALLSQKKLKSSLLDYIAGDLVRDYIVEEVTPKLQRIVQTCRKLYGANKKRGTIKVTNYILNNSKFKLPWEVKELEDAKESVLRLVDKVFGSK